VAALKGIFTDIVETQVSYVNAPVMAAERGIDVRLLTQPDSAEFRNVVTVRGTLADGSVLSVSGTLTGPRQVHKLVDVDGFELEVPLAEHLLVLRYTDRPGVIGVVGRLLGDAGVNIAAMQVGRKGEGGDAVSVLTLDDNVPPGLPERVASEIGAASVHVVKLDEVP
jgi:D-3-phosphoglycerate dehydrogenase